MLRVSIAYTPTYAYENEYTGHGRRSWLADPHPIAMPARLVIPTRLYRHFFRHGLHCSRAAQNETRLCSQQLVSDIAIYMYRYRVRTVNCDSLHMKNQRATMN